MKRVVYLQTTCHQQSLKNLRWLFILDESELLPPANQRSSRKVMYRAPALGTHLYSPPPPPPYISNLFNLDLQYEASIFVKQAVGILVECFLVYFISTVNHGHFYEPKWYNWTVLSHSLSFNVSYISKDCQKYYLFSIADC